MSVYNQPLFVSAIRDHGRSLVNISAVFSHNDAEQKRLYQQVVLAIWQALPHYTQQQDLCIFIYRVAFNCVYRQATKNEPSLIDTAQGSALLKVMRQLPLLHRQLLCLVFDEFSHEDIAAICGLEVQQVAIAIETAQQHFRQKMALIDQASEVSDA